VLEDITLDAALDENGRLVAETNTRQVAANLGLHKDTVTRHLRRLRE
jgi:DNA-binding transcriptional ArsR family regulator